MNILLINHYAGSPKMGMEFRPYYMAREWQKKSNNVLIVTSSFSHTRKIQFETEKIFTYTEIDGIKYFVIKTPKYSGNGFGRIRNMASFIKACLNKSKYIAETFKPDIVISSSTYPLDNYPARKICKLSGAKMIYEVHDLWPLSPQELGGYSKYHPFIMMMQAAENFAYKHCNAVVSLLPKAKEHMIEHGLHPDKFHYVPNGVVIDDWKTANDIPKEFRALFQQQKSKEHKIIGYTGSHGPANSLNTLLEAMFELKEEPFSLFLIGDGPEKPKLIKTAVKLKLQNVFFLHQVNKDLIPPILDQFDILYIGLQNQPLFRFGISPNKLLDYMMAGKPIIQAINAGNDMVTEANCGVSIEPENVNKLTEAIIKMTKLSDDELNKMGKNGNEYVLRNNSYNILSQKFLKLMEKLITEKAN
ncbi:MAG TPA: glycosyltransferase family 4 protein [Bacteroidales bacterium]|nr:glycosyltransferase family 4 protein [Bacteroidales bacterium]MDD4235347.1 glycosyltransferase family 4 protein [Bacteroidales bacterium]HRW21054.1 glycosyltransferase family 4 protein [Bacteroidales bacterium]HXK81442.1 glycosyltransferase family 4 protein [Bacteroidales bacterium]